MLTNHSHTLFWFYQVNDLHVFELLHEFHFTLEYTSLYCKQLYLWKRKQGYRVWSVMLLSTENESFDLACVWTCVYSSVNTVRKPNSNVGFHVWTETVSCPDWNRFRKLEQTGSVRMLLLRYGLSFWTWWNRRALSWANTPPPRPDSPLMKPKMNSLDLDSHLDLHQMAHTHTYQSLKCARFKNYSLRNLWKMSYLKILERVKINSWIRALIRIHRKM